MCRRSQVASKPDNVHGVSIGHAFDIKLQTDIHLKKPVTGPRRMLRSRTRNEVVSMRTRPVSVLAS